MQLMSGTSFLASRSFKRGEYDVDAPREGGARRTLLRLVFDREDGEGVRRIPVASLPADLRLYERSLVASALVRAGVQHPGLRDEDLVMLHREASSEHHVELFTDLNALTTGLLQHVARSLGGAVARVVISSSSIDILHEYQGRISRKTTENGDFLRRAEMARALRLLEEMRRDVPVHVHQLPPGASRYFQRKSAASSQGEDPGGDTSAELDPLTFISEDRQMIAAYWDYMTRDNPRLPVRLITSDFALAHVCVAERLPFLFARSPFEIWREPAGPEACEPRLLWLDPFALALRFATPDAILWELCSVFERLVVHSPDDVGFSLGYEPRAHLPGACTQVHEGPAKPEPPPVPPRQPPKEALAAGDSKGATKAPAGAPRHKPQKPPPVRSEPSRLAIRLPLVLDALPSTPGGRISLAVVKVEGTALRQLEQIGLETRLYQVGSAEIEAGPALAALIAALEAQDYLAVNAIFRKVRAYDEALREAAGTGLLPNAKSGGTATGWAVMLGAAYKTNSGACYGLAEVSAKTFAEAIAQAHAECGEGRAAVPLPEILDRVCRALSLSPIRFEAALDKYLREGTLTGYEAQRATISMDLPEHDVLVAPSAAEHGHYLRHLVPGKGVVLGGSLVSSLVLRRGGS
jgi:hypothetical protein